MDLSEEKRIARLYERLPQGRVLCKICPRGCKLKSGQKGFCRTRQNFDGNLYTLVFGKACRVAQEFMETEGVFHYAPGSSILSIGNIGCNLNCKFCQNWKTSQMQFISANDFELYTPKQIVNLAINKNINVLSWTYNDPVVWHEFVMDTALLARKNGLLNLYKSAFYITLDTLKELCEVIDIFSISLKSISEDFYRKYTKATLEPVLRNIKYVYQKGIYLELSNLMVTDLNDSEEDARAIVQWHLENISSDVPLHFVSFHPAYLYKNVTRTPLDRLKRAREIALEMGVKYCYIGNVHGIESGNSFCPGCNDLLIRRYDINTEIIGLTNKGKCINCGYQTNIKVKPFGTVMKQVENENYKFQSKEVYRWTEEINRLHIEVKNPENSEADVIVYRLGTNDQPSSNARKTKISPQETYCFMISQSRSDETGIMICYPPNLKIRILELMDRAHVPTEFKEKKLIQETIKTNFKDKLKTFVPWRNSLPSWFVKKINYPLYSNLKGLKTIELIKELEISQLYDSERMHLLQLKKLKTLLIHSKQHVPYYQKVFRELNFQPENMNNIDDIRMLPIIEKSDLQHNGEEFKTKGKEIPFFKAKTNGSTGIPLSLLTDYNSVAHNIASRIRAERWWNLDYGMKEVHFWGRGFDKPSFSLQIKDWFIRNKITLYTLNLTDEIMYDHYKKLLKFDPQIIYGNPSAIYIFSRFLIENRLNVSKLRIKAIISSTEVLHEYQRQFIHSVFKCPVINEYGATEAGIIAYECPCNNMHINADNIIVEILKDGKRAGLNEFGEIVVTNLNNLIMPIIRYKIGDVGRFIPNNCECGLKLPLLDVIIGRDCDTIILKDKELPGAVLFGRLGGELVNLVSGEIESYRIYQKDLNRFLFQIVLKKYELKNLIEKRAKEIMTEYLGPDTSIEFEYVDSIPREESGKLRYFISEVLN